MKIYACNIFYFARLINGWRKRERSNSKGQIQAGPMTVFFPLSLICLPHGQHLTTAKGESFAYSTLITVCYSTFDLKVTRTS